MNLIRKLCCFTAALACVASSGMAAAETKPEIRIGYVEGWSDSVATTYVAAQIIRQNLGYEVKLVPVSAGLMWQGVARGDLDATMSAWLPVTQGAYYEKLKDKVVNLGVNYPGARIGLIVPAYVNANSLADLPAQKAAFEGRIVGIDAGAGVMTKTELAIKEYALDYKLMPSSGSGMVAELERSIRNNKAIAVTGWVPHWMFAKWKLKFLEDPKKVYGEAEHVDNIANPGLAAKAKPVNDLLKHFSWKPGELDSVMLAIESGEKPEAAARKWVNANAERVGQWLQPGQ
ncbi:glycine betaine ABC transporter substrate-binding protein [Collimonas sp.]|jgi:glycine betaine/proline transport system substrate-binding protein|uniref:glycine betaine ABC transporter substrate-binding protein n=1 Tax=Collimonas sp. TaxID=1963772 RepID=UPI002B5B5EE0|nr:glycine betaine ABC transporter substrate-binding protein [Collimonas sp.]HWW08509.1 glycine betaine ABC transporter substrate-binding protein [Collimonas sp.]